MPDITHQYTPEIMALTREYGQFTRSRTSAFVPLARSGPWPVSMCRLRTCLTICPWEILDVVWAGCSCRERTARRWAWCARTNLAAVRPGRDQRAARRDSHRHVRLH